MSGLSIGLVGWANASDRANPVHSVTPLRHCLSGQAIKADWQPATLIYAQNSCADLMDTFHKCSGRARARRSKAKAYFSRFRCKLDGEADGPPQMQNQMTVLIAAPCKGLTSVLPISLVGRTQLKAFAKEVA